jgi:putative ATPase
MKELGYGSGYGYGHEAKNPDGMQREQFYRPPDRGFEREVAGRLDHWAKLRPPAAAVSGWEIGSVQSVTAGLVPHP